MPSRFDTLARRALEHGETLHQDVAPDEFGPPRDRLTAFKEALLKIVSRCPEVRLRVSGSRRALAALDLAPGASMFLVNHMCPVSLGKAGGAGQIRISFSPKA